MSTDGPTAGATAAAMAVAATAAAATTAIAILSNDCFHGVHGVRGQFSDALVT